MKILAIETSCDETAIALLDNFKIIKRLVASQIKIHAPYGGVVPHLASREHEKNLPILFKKIKSDFDVVALTIGPGLSPCLWQGINFAKKLNKPILPVNHLEGHIYANWPFSAKGRPASGWEFPVLALVVSGGHTQIVLMKGHQNYKTLGQTRDDAAGEAFDKVAKLLNLGYPGGPIIEKMAQKGDPKKYDLPRPMMHSQNYDFSFSGLKTAVLYLVRSADKINKADLCASFQSAVIDVLLFKTKKAFEEFKPKSVVFGGGVMANKALRQAIKNSLHTAYCIPDPEFCLDNAVMIALAASFKKKLIKPKDFDKIEAKPNLNLEDNSI
ncbi:MAG: tRNA (adenosine(37)-N6)-threonylcarbamoyltransferase complex transferase subunit TsaD [Candidatus Portnoybacteria bacterium CG23_combo_of_CG06-09_8_20_14_all_37_13]|uniref:tRNA N6-adenosine threonylcarbamoyltransferase n=1 Tax=Candidatus Portnoybacteria bacterium CG23_combo_of_CG06-09_8_20_14_all_37_13 TaxID=1974819 RepID=A0A2G9YD83_9BACT|nr:MAG: tRNA (adenosine(37)-N6)-threonylcarbamoyltransferase complex transferase subunit TsaD [Candidatus Portnoybacteria bacterium CG23_combo_of_CG06-09_8_20_14_all_37_13]